jgi:hypothetical protein
MEHLFGNKLIGCGFNILVVCYIIIHSDSPRHEGMKSIEVMGQSQHKYKTLLDVIFELVVTETLTRY